VATRITVRIHFVYNADAVDWGLSIELRMAAIHLPTGSTPSAVGQELTGCSQLYISTTAASGVENFLPEWGIEKSIPHPGVLNTEENKVTASNNNHKKASDPPEMLEVATEPDEQHNLIGDDD
jgi:hypothetical protein